MFIENLVSTRSDNSEAESGIIKRFGVTFFTRSAAFFLLRLVAKNGQPTRNQ